jgi:hypothetical protein
LKRFVTSKMRVAGRSIVAFTLISILLGACGRVEPVDPSTPTTTGLDLLQATLGATVENTPTAIAPPPTQAPPASSPTPAEVVQVTVSGNVYVRRGPDLAFNSVAILYNGETVTATARDVLSNWLRVALPSGDPREGWISIMSGFTTVSGSVEALPEIDPQEWPELASVRNCTPHEMWIDPAGLTLPPASEFPNNDVVLNPGLYSIIDVDVDGYPQVMEIDLAEGDAIDVIFDGLGEKKVCPRP